MKRKGSRVEKQGSRSPGSRVQVRTEERSKGSGVPGTKKGTQESGRRKGVLRNYKDLQVWQKAYQLCLEVYRATGEFPKHELYGITAQMRRAAVSIPSNISEGYGRKTTKEYIQFLYVAYGSTCELETQVLLSADLGYIGKELCETLVEKIGAVERMLKALINSLEKKSSNP